MLSSVLHASVFRLFSVTELAEDILWNMRLYIITYAMTVSKSPELWTFSNFFFPLHTNLYTEVEVRIISFSAPFIVNFYVDKGFCD